MDQNWDEFHQATKDRGPWPQVERAAGLVGHVGDALDLGCGAGRDTRYLLSQGWRVTAVDKEPGAMAILAGMPQENLSAVQSPIEDFKYEPGAYDLISAQFSLPFIAPARLREVFSRVKQALKPGGVFAGQFFGMRDEWNRPGSGMSFWTREEVEGLLADMSVIDLEEEENMGSTATGGSKWWHVFNVIARRRE